MGLRVIETPCRPPKQSSGLGGSAFPIGLKRRNANGLTVIEGQLTEQPQASWPPCRIAGPARAGARARPTALPSQPFARTASPDRDNARRVRAPPIAASEPPDRRRARKPRYCSPLFPQQKA